MKLFLFTTMFLTLFFIACSSGSGGSAPATDNQSVNDDTPQKDDTPVKDDTPESDSDEPVTDLCSGPGCTEGDDILTDTDVVTAGDDADLVTDECAGPGCGDDKDIPAVDEDNTSSDEDSAPITFNATGTWAQKNIMVATTKTSALGQEIKSEATTQSFLLLSMEDTAGSVKATATICSLSVDSGTTMIEIKISENYISALEPSSFNAEVTKSNSNILFTSDKVFNVSGVKLDNPGTDAMPKDGTDDRIFDQDKDGKPGMTINVTGHIPVAFNGDGAMYLAERATQIMNGKATKNDLIEGSVVWTDEQVILDATNNILKSPKSMEPILDKSSFKMVKIDNTWDCEDIMANKDILFK